MLPLPTAPLSPGTLAPGPTPPAPTPTAVPAAERDAGHATRVLLVEDNPADAHLIGEYFDAASAPGVAVERVERLGDALDRLADGRFDVVLLDLSLPDASGLEGVNAVIARAPGVPVVVMTGLADDRVAVAAVQAGAQDYLVKGQDGARVVRRAVRHAIERHRLRREREGLLASEREARAAAEHAARARDEVLGIVSHDLRNPLSTIVMSAHALAARSGDDPDGLAEVIVRSSEWALRIIRDLLDVTAIEAGRLAIHREPMTVQAIAEMVRSLFELPARSAGVALAVELHAPPRWIEADVDRVVQAVGNLVGNAIKFTPRGGRVSLVVSGASGAEGEGAGAVLFRVEDTGPGIATEHLPHLFDRFWQVHASRRGGAGLGLTIAQGIAAGHGGRIDVESRVGQGSAFTLVLPVAP